MTSVMNSAAAAEAKLFDLHGPQVFIPDTEVINPQPAEKTNVCGARGLQGRRGARALEDRADRRIPQGTVPIDVDWSWYRFAWGVVGAAAPEIVRLYKQLTKTPPGEVPWDQTNRRHHMRLQLLTADGFPVQAQQAPEQPPQAIEAGGDFEVGRPAGIAPGSPLGVSLAISIGPVPLPPNSRFVWRS